MLCLDSKVNVAYYLSILLSLNASLLQKLNIVSFSCFPETGQNVLENLQNLEQFACKMRVRIHGFFTQQLNFASQETSVFSLSASLRPSILIKHFGLKTTFQSKMLVFICLRFSPNSEQTDISRHQWRNDAVSTVCRNPNSRDKKLFRNGSFCSHSHSPLASVPQKHPGSEFGWHARAGEQVG